MNPQRWRLPAVKVNCRRRSRTAKAATAATEPAVEISPQQLTALPTVSEVLSAIQKEAPESLSNSILQAALERLQAAPAYSSDKSQQAAVHQLLDVGWQRLGSLEADALVNLLVVAAAWQCCSPERVAAWTEQFTAAKGGGNLGPEARVNLLEAGRILQQQQREQEQRRQQQRSSSDEDSPPPAAEPPAVLPAGLLVRNLKRVCRQDVAGKLSLRRLAQLYSCAEELELQLTASEHCGLSRIVRARLAGDFHEPSVVKVLTAWVSMQQRYQKWSAGVSTPRDPDSSTCDKAGSSNGGSGGSGTGSRPRRSRRSSGRGSAAGSGGQSDGGAGGGGGMGVASVAEGHGVAAEQQQQQQQRKQRGKERQQQQQRPEELSSFEQLPSARHEEGKQRNGTDYGPPKQLLDPIPGAVPQIAGFPGEDVMEALVQQAQAHSSEMSVGGLSQLLYVLGALRYAPSQQVMEDLVAALEPRLASGQRAREVTAAMDGLAKLGCDPGEGFARACMAVVEADGGKDKALVSTVARSLAVLKRCTPDMWARLVHLMETPNPSAPKPPKLPAKHLPWRKWLPGWLTSYLLMQEQYPGNKVVGEPLQFPGGVLRLQQAVRAYRREVTEVDAAAREVGQVLQGICGDSHPVHHNYRIRDLDTGAPMLLDLAVPSLRLAVQLERWFDRTVNTGAPASKALIRGRLLRHWGWQLVVVPGAVQEAAVRPASTVPQGPVQAAPTEPSSAVQAPGAPAEGDTSSEEGAGQVAAAVGAAAAPHEQAGGQPHAVRPQRPAVHAVPPERQSARAFFMEETLVPQLLLAAAHPPEAPVPEVYRETVDI
ncbi:hypothetical protein N2152v2_010455 [Parachlorella kessleri]